MDVGAAIRRTRLPFVASLLLAALLGAPATMEPAPVAGPRVVAGPAATVPAEAETPAAESPAEPAETATAVEVRADTPPAGPGLTDQADRAALASRSPPTL